MAGPEAAPGKGTWRSQGSAGGAEEPIWCYKLLSGLRFHSEQTGSCYMVLRLELTRPDLCFGGFTLSSGEYAELFQRAA